MSKQKTLEDVIAKFIKDNEGKWYNEYSFASAIRSHLKEVAGGMITCPITWNLKNRLNCDRPCSRYRTCKYRIKNQALNDLVEAV